MMAWPLVRKPPALCKTNQQGWHYDGEGTVIFHRENEQTEGLLSLCHEAQRVLDTTGCLPRMLEVGSHAGESAAIFSMFFGEVYCVDTWSETDLRDVSEKLPPEDVVKSFDARMAKSKQRIVKVKCKSPRAAKLFPDRWFDLIYLDGAHDLESVSADLVAWVPKTKRLMAGHDWVDECSGVRDAVSLWLGHPDWLFEDYSWMIDVRGKVDG